MQLKHMSKRLNLLNQVIKYTTAFILLAVPLFPKFPFIRIPQTFVAIRLEDLLIAFSGALLVQVIFPNTFAFLKDRLNRSIILYILVGLVSLISAIFVTKTVVAHIGLLHWLRRIEYFIPLYLGMEAVKRKRLNLLVLQTTQG